MTSIMRIITFGVIILCSALPSVHSWWSNGHLISKLNFSPNLDKVARIAYDELSKDLIERANKMLSHLKDYTTLESKHPFVECATFGDEIKNKGWES